MIKIPLEHYEALQFGVHALSAFFSILSIILIFNMLKKMKGGQNLKNE